MRRESKWLRAISCGLAIAFFLTGCAITRSSVRVQEHEMYGSQVYERSWDEHGRPVFTMLPERPITEGNSFFLVDFQDNRPSISYELVIENEPSRDYLSPVSEFFKNMASSLLYGLALGYAFLEIAEDNENIDDWSAFEAGMAIGTAGGVVYSGFSFGMDASKLVVNRMEEVVSEAHYSYDETGRITGMITMPPLGNQWESTTTKFFYEGDSTVPTRTETKNSHVSKADPDTR